VSEHGPREEHDAPAPAAPVRDGTVPVAPSGSAAALHVLGLQRTAGNAAVVQYLQQHGALSTPGDPLEEEADRAAGAVMGGQAASLGRSPGAPADDLGDVVDAGVTALGAGEPLARQVREYMEPRFGTDFGDVRVHTDAAAGKANTALQAEAFTYGQDIYFAGHRSPANDALTAHELSHVVQQRRGGGGLAAKRIQPSFTASYKVALGVFEIDWQTRQGAVNTPATHSGFDGYMRFVPNPDAPNSNKITFIQIVKLTDATGTDVDPLSMAPGQAPRGALGDAGVRTQDDAARGVQGGYFTDVYHQPGAPPGVPQGTPLSPDYQFQPAAAGTVGAGQTVQPAIYGGGTGGRLGQTPGFKRSNESQDIRSAAMYDTPGTTSNAVDLNFDFESVVRGEDTMFVYGAVQWGFHLRKGKVVDEYLNAVDGQSATFDEALERHRDFYVHEPVTFYFDFDKATLNAPELAKIDEFLAYLTRNPTVRMSIAGFADIKGGASRHNLDLSMNRAEAVRKALIDKGVDESRIDDIMIGMGADSSATGDAGTGDQGGDAAVGADQTREANRWANRRVVLTFEQTASTPVGGAVV
jgi:outer membrane protein OmpA-like peptidoglycan-associated protein